MQKERASVEISRPDDSHRIVHTHRLCVQDSLMEIDIDPGGDEIVEIGSGNSTDYRMIRMPRDNKIYPDPSQGGKVERHHQGFIGDKIGRCDDYSLLCTIDSL